MVRVILDTNVLINGVQDDYSYAYRIIRLCLEGKLQAIVSRPIEREYRLKANELIADESYLDLLDDLLDRAEEVDVRSRVRVIEEDPQDNKFFSCAQDGEADFIISDDAHLLDFGSYKNTRIVTPDEFWGIYTEEIAEEESVEWKEWVRTMGI
jgi:putative PIN family toxin of toxin-antitoxin system